MQDDDETKTLRLLLRLARTALVDSPPRSDLAEALEVAALVREIDRAIPPLAVTVQDMHIRCKPVNYGGSS